MKLCDHREPLALRRGNRCMKYKIICSCWHMAACREPRPLIAAFVVGTGLIGFLLIKAMA